MAVRGEVKAGPRRFLVDRSGLKPPQQLPRPTQKMVTGREPEMTGEKTVANLITDEGQLITAKFFISGGSYISSLHCLFMNHCQSTRLITNNKEIALTIPL